MPNRFLLSSVAAAAALSSLCASTAPTLAAKETWAFAVSGDSRDCGDLIMPKIARAVLAEQTPPISFYWHLGDFRRMYDIDCDIVKRTHTTFDCRSRASDQLGNGEMSEYTRTAWDDFIEYEVKPFGSLPVFLGIGNHELSGRTRDEFRRAFLPWLSQKPIPTQRLSDAARKSSAPVGSTWYHFVKRGVDFITLDNGDESMFSREQIVWLSRVLGEDARDPAIRTIVVGMHEALPYSVSRGHAMDRSCQGLCSGQQVYDLLFRAQNLVGPPEKRRHVYVLASHAHTFLENVYDTPEHRGQVLPGWIVGTAGAVQSSETISYGYLRMEVGPGGAVTPLFREVTRASLPLGTGPGAESLGEFCFEGNWRKAGEDAFKGDCACGSTPQRSD